MSEFKYLTYLGFASVNLGIQTLHESKFFIVVFGLAALLFCAAALVELRRSIQENKNE